MVLNLIAFIILVIIFKAAHNFKTNKTLCYMEVVGLLLVPICKGIHGSKLRSCTTYSTVAKYSPLNKLKP